MTSGNTPEKIYVQFFTAGTEATDEIRIGTDEIKSAIGNLNAESRQAIAPIKSNRRFACEPGSRFRCGAVRDSLVDSSPNPDDDRRAYASLIVYPAIASLAVVATYPLSMGPMLWLATHGYLSEETRVALSGFYQPLWIASMYVPYLDQFLHWYIGFWDG